MAALACPPDSSWPVYFVSTLASRLQTVSATRVTRPRSGRSHQASSPKITPGTAVSSTNRPSAATSDSPSAGMITPRAVAQVDVVGHRMR